MLTLTPWGLHSTGSTTQPQSEPGSNYNEGILHTSLVSRNGSNLSDAV